MTTTGDIGFYDQTDPASAASDRDETERLLLDIKGFEGPLDVLLSLSRTQKVDLKQISILELVEQYLVFITEATRLRLEVAADYLVMAAWLAYLKSRLLLPVEENDEDISADELAARLTYQLQRLEAMREAAAKLMSRDQLGRDVFARGAPEPVHVTRNASYELSFYELLKGYAEHKIRKSVSDIRIHKREVFTLDQALERLGDMIGLTLDWTSLEAFLPPDLKSGEMIKSAKASLFTATLEMARQGKAEIVQKQIFGPLLIRSRSRED
ncbi:ScpA family protein [Emcibacter sp.]|uniref:segregation and condensation protein A n=1 Tax=Emcibacter sp. TaxID=1979954 RepID=UPI002AA858B7|nr:ScpA family protein [Emcibacter sp.]